MPAVTVRCMNDVIPSAPVPGVQIEFYSTGAIFQTSGTTDEDGEVTVTLPISDYDILFYKPGVTILPRQPQRIEVLEEDNDFTVECHERTVPETIKTNRTRVTGKFMMVHGGAVRERLVFYLKKDLLVYSDATVELGGRYEVASDENGCFDFELLRNQEYYVQFIHLDTMLGEAAGKLEIKVPDVAGVDLGTLLFPVPVNLSFSLDEATLTLDGGISSEIDAAITYSDGGEKKGGNLWSGISLTNSDNTVVESAIQDGKLFLKPLSAGTAYISSVRSIKDSAYFEDVPEYTTDVLTVTVV